VVRRAPRDSRGASPRAPPGARRRPPPRKATKKTPRPIAIHKMASAQIAIAAQDPTTPVAGHGARRGPCRSSPPPLGEAHDRRRHGAEVARRPGDELAVLTLRASDAHL